MARASNREKILQAGLDLVHGRGFGAASVRDIVQAAGVPQGSFTNHFPSKQAFGLEVLDLYFANIRAMLDVTLLDESRAPLDRLRAYVETYSDRFRRNGRPRGCLFGNLSAEVEDCGEPIRERLVAIFGEIRAAIATCLRAAVAAGELSSETDCEDLAGMIQSSLQGALLLAKAERSPEPIVRFQRVLFSTLLR